MKRKMILAVVGAFLSTTAAHAEPITYTFAGLFSGSLAGTDFTQASVSFTLTSDTDTVFQPRPTLRPTLYNSAPGTLRFSVNGAAGEFNALYNAFSVTLFNNQSVVGLTETGSNDLIDVVDPSLRGYDLKTAAGPVLNSPLDFLNFDTSFQTTLGELVLFDDDASSVTFSASLAGVVPEPASWAMMIAGAGLTGGAMRRRRTMRAVISFA